MQAPSLSSASRVLVIDDDEDLGEILVRYLSAAGFAVTLATTPSVGLAHLRMVGADIVLLDVMLPEQDGFSVCRTIVGQPEIYRHVPVIMLTARGDVFDRVVGLEIGADDYLPKPFEPRELLARIRSVIRRRSLPPPPLAPPPPTPAPAAGLHIDRAGARVWVDGQEIELTGMEWGLLALISAAPGRLFSRDDIVEALRGIESDIFSRAVDALVSRLRAKLGDTARTPRFIKTVWGRGYVFVDRD